MCINEANQIALQAEVLPEENNPQVIQRFLNILKVVLKTKDEFIMIYVTKLVKLLRITDIELALISLVVEPLEWANFSGIFS